MYSDNDVASHWCSLSMMYDVYLTHLTHYFLLLTQPESCILVLSTHPACIPASPLDSHNMNPVSSTYSNSDCFCILPHTNPAGPQRELLPCVLTPAVLSSVRSSSSEASGRPHFARCSSVNLAGSELLMSRLWAVSKLLCTNNLSWHY